MAFFVLFYWVSRNFLELPSGIIQWFVVVGAVFSFFVSIYIYSQM